eukprot:SAG31_NODE_14965_length_778_cov_0.917526_2_plen_138_part_00
MIRRGPARRRGAHQAPPRLLAQMRTSRRQKPYCAAVGVIAALLAHADAGATDPTCETDPNLAGMSFCNFSLPIDARVEDLLGRLTVEEKTTAVLESGGSVPRLGIPHLGTTECLRGYLSMFPQALALSQSWNRSLVR